MIVSGNDYERGFAITNTAFFLGTFLEGGEGVGEVLEGAAKSRTLNRLGKKLDLTEADYVVSNWKNSSFDNKTQSIKYHYNKHVTEQGINKSLYEYTNDAANVYNKYSKSGTDVILSDGSTGTKIKDPDSSQGGIYTKEGDIVSFWYK